MFPLQSNAHRYNANSNLFKRIEVTYNVVSQHIKIKLETASNIMYSRPFRSWHAQDHPREISWSCSAYNTNHKSVCGSCGSRCCFIFIKAFHKPSTTYSTSVHLKLFTVFCSFLGLSFYDRDAGLCPRKSNSSGNCQVTECWLML